MFAFRDTREGGVVVDVAFTDSTTSLAEPADRPAEGSGTWSTRVADLEAECGVPLLRMHQVHGAGVQVVEDWRSSVWDPHVDGLVTAQTGVGLMVRAADCVPVLLADAGKGVVGAAHAGRQGVAVGVVPATVAAMRRLGADDIVAWVGPHICGGCYEVPKDLRDEVTASVPSTWSVTTWGTPALDLGAGVSAQLAEAGCEALVVEGCTREDPRWHSFRRDGALSGRFAGLVWIRP